MSHRIVLSIEARGQLDAIYAYIATAASPVTALEFASAIRQARAPAPQTHQSRRMDLAFGAIPETFAALLIRGGLWLRVRPPWKTSSAAASRREACRCDWGTGRSRPLGTAGEPTLEVHVDRAAILRMMTAPSSLTLGECYMEGTIRLEKGGIFDLVALVARNSRFGPMKDTWLKRLRRGIRQRNDADMARRNASHHYDLSVDLYRRFLDVDLQYSCAYFARPDMTLDEAQAAKRARIATKLLLRPGDRVLDIGCGWGGLGLELAGRQAIDLLGVTLATEQQATAQARAQAAGLDNRVRFAVQDYRAVEGPFQRIVSIGMLEHVGQPNFDAYFKKIAELMTDDGVALVHSIGRKHGVGITNPFLDKYIFPGGYIPLLSEVLPSVERAGLQVADIEMWRLHYAETLRHWRERFAVARAEIALMYDERFCRMFEYYLAISEVAFRWAGFAVFQLQLVKTVDAVPITRAYVEQA